MPKAIKPELKSSEAAILHSLKCDIAEEKDVLATFQWIKKNLKSVHIVINNAGVLTKGSLIGKFKESYLQKLFYKGLMTLRQAIQLSLAERPKVDN